ncbi:MAG: DUF362 domain-containing protein [bacterium]|nr:DUF362 domain-containing protein [bacterium]
MSFSQGGVTRRQFLKGAVALLAMPGAVIGPGGSAAAAPGGISTLSVAEGPDPYAITVEAVEKLGGMAAFVNKGDRVLVKPNIGWDRRVEQAANTHPEVVRALAEMCLAAGAQKVVILDRSCNDARRCYRTSGMQEMAEKLPGGKVSLDHVLNNRFVNTAIPMGVSVKSWPLYEEALKADAIINVPVAKHHSISRLTLGMKNLMGLMGGNRGTFHSGIGQKLADLTSVLMPELTVLDATRILVRNGPTGGRMEDVRVLDRVAASADPVAIDAYGATLFDVRAEDLSFVTAAYRMGLGEMDLGKVRILRS